MVRGKLVAVGALVQEHWQRFPHRWLKAAVVISWGRAFPSLRGRLKCLSISNSRLYITLDSLWLTHRLRRRQGVVLAALKREVADLGVVVPFERIVFL